MMKAYKFAVFAALPILLQLRTARGADTPTAQAGAYQNSVEQERLRAQTARVRKELLALFDEYKVYPVASSELAQAKAAVDSLESLSDKDMVAVVKVLRQASQADNANGAKDGLLTASSSQKSIQSTLRALADKMALEKNQIAVRKRLLDLLLRQMTQQHQTQRLVDGSTYDYEMPRATKLVLDEQIAIKEEVTQLLATLEKLGQGPDSPATQAYKAALAAGEKGQLNAQSEVAVTDATAKVYPKTIADQGAAVTALTGMLTAFDSTVPEQERIETMVGEMKDLTARQNRLAVNTQGVYFMAQHEVKNPQQRLDDEAAAFAQEIAQLNPAAGGELSKARQAMHTIDEAFKTKNYMEKEAKRWEIIGLEKDSSRSFTETATILQKQADALAAAASGGQGPSSAQDPTLAQINDASQHIMNAQDKMDAAMREMQQKESSDAAREAIDKARGELDQARSEVSALGSAVPKGAGENLKSADGKSAASRAKVGDGSDQMRNSWTLGGAKEDAGKALEQLQAAANRIAAEQAGGKGQTTGNPNQQANAWGGPGTPGNDNSGGNTALAAISSKDRDALAVLSHETAPPDYNTMVEQYRKNLANGELPTQ